MTLELYIFRLSLGATRRRLRPSFAALRASYEDELAEVLVLRVPENSQVEGEFLTMNGETFSPDMLLRSCLGYRNQFPIIHTASKRFPFPKPNPDLFPMPSFLNSLGDDLGAFIGNATEKEVSQLDERIGNMLAVSEELRSGFALIRDLFIFTSHRLIYVDYKGVTGIQVEFQSIPYRSLTSWSFESAGPLGISQTLRLWIAGFPEPFKIDFPRDADVLALEVGLAEALFLPSDQGDGSLRTA